MRNDRPNEVMGGRSQWVDDRPNGGDASALPTRPVGAVLSWESYCAAVDVDPEAARRATVVGALHALLTRYDMCLRPPRLPTFDGEAGPQD